MSVLGWILAVIGLAGVVYGLLQMNKQKKLNTVPFRRPSEIAQQGPAAADAKGMVSTEGQIVPAQQLVAPMSGQPCLAYEIVIERKWEKSEQTENGVQKKTGTDRVHREYKGSWFQLSDGTGAVYVDATKEPDTDLEKSHNSTVNIGMMIPGTLQFGQMHFNTPMLPRDSTTTAFVGTEKVIKPVGNIYALGGVQQGPQGIAIGTPAGLTTGKLILSNKGREHLIGKTKRNMTLGYAVGGVLFVSGTALGIFGPAPGPGNGCHNFSNTITCSDRLYAASGQDYTWTVTTPGIYSVTVSQPNVQHPIDSTITVFNAAGQQIAYNDGGSPGANAMIMMPFLAGTYRINVRDFARETVSGGFSFSLAVASPMAGAAGAATTAGMAGTPGAVGAAGAAGAAGGAVATPIQVGQTVPGALMATDHALTDGSVGDDYAVTLAAGQAITIVTRGGPSVTEPGSTLDVYTVLLDATGQEITHDDDSAAAGTALNSRIVYTATAPGTYTIRVTTFGSGLKQGAYILQTYAGALPNQL